MATNRTKNLPAYMRWTLARLMAEVEKMPAEERTGDSEAEQLWGQLNHLYEVEPYRGKSLDVHRVLDAADKFLG